MDNLIIPIYIDTNALLDLLASIEGGFSVVEKVTTRNANTKELDRSVNTGSEFGVPNVLNMFKVTLGFTSNWKKADEAEKQSEAERYHTYGSLLYRLRKYLDENKLIKRLEDFEDKNWKILQPSDFVEVRGIFRPNPLADSLNVIIRLLDLSQLFTASALTTPASHSKGNKSQPGKHSQVNTSNKAPQLNQIKSFIQGILADIEKEGIRIFIVELPSSEMPDAVVLLFVDYLRDKTMIELSHKEYFLLGKVVRKLEQVNNETIDLLRGTGLGGVGKTTIDQLVNSFSLMEGKMNLPDVKTEIRGPALEIVPIAIFV